MKVSFLCLLGKANWKHVATFLQTPFLEEKERLLSEAVPDDEQDQSRQHGLGSGKHRLYSLTKTH